MTLVEAKAQALENSKGKKKVFIENDEQGNAVLSAKRTPSSLFLFEDGKEVPLPPLPKEAPKKEEKEQTKPSKKVETKEVPAKKASKTVLKKQAVKEQKMKKAAAAKKAAPKPAKKAAAVGVSRATTITLDNDAQWSKVEAFVEKSGKSIRELSTLGLKKMCGIA